MAHFLKKTEFWFVLILLVTLSCADPNKCFYHTDCDNKQSCLASRCVGWICETNKDCDKGARVCNKISHTCQKCLSHWDCDKGKYCLGGVCDPNNPTCTSNGILEVCKGCLESSDCPDGMSCERYKPDNNKLICKR